MAAVLKNLARMTTATTGTGTLTLGAAVAGYLSFDGAGVPDGATVSYGIKDTGASEAGRGRYTKSGTTLSRDTISESTNAGSPINLSGAAEVFVTALAEDFLEATLLAHARLGGI
jgi:hypothetical protein